MNKKLSLLNGHYMATLLIIILALFCVSLKLENNQMVQTLESNYSRSLYELVEYLDDVETLLAKAQISSSSEYAAKNLTQIWRKADLAQATLSEIPITHMTLEKVVQFLNQLSDYSYTVSKKTIENKDLSDEELKNIGDFYGRAKNLNITLRGLTSDMANGSLSWKELTEKEDTALFAQEVANVSQDSFGKIEENMQDYEGLIYDGPFSEHMANIEPKGLGEAKFDEKLAREKIYEYMPKEKIKNIEYLGLIEANVEVHSFNVTLNDDSKFYIDVSEKGGEIIWFMRNREVNDEKTSAEEAIVIGKRFLDEHGIKNMKDNYYVKENNMITINYAYMDGDVICYPDLVKVKVALDNGEVLGMEAQRYYIAHHNRNIETQNVSIASARATLNKGINITSEGVAIIPTEWATEVLTYEFKGNINDKEFIVYVNAKTGKEEKIFMIVDTPNGKMTV